MYGNTDPRNKTEAKGDKSTSDASFQTLIRRMNSRTYQAPHDHTREGASPSGVAATAYQEDETGTGVPVNHTSGARTAVEQGRQARTDGESQAEKGDKTMVRPYLKGVRFTARGDHKQRLQRHNDRTRTTPGRVIRHRNKVQDHRFTDKYQEGKARPGDHVTSHGAPNKGRNERKQERQGNNHGNFHHGQLGRDPNKQSAKKKTRERGRGRRGKGGGDRDHMTRHGAPNGGRDEEEQERQGNNHGDSHRGQLTWDPTKQGAERKTRGRGGRGGGDQKTRSARGGDWEGEGTVRLSQIFNTGIVNV